MSLKSTKLQFRIHDVTVLGTAKDRLKEFGSIGWWGDAYLFEPSIGLAFPSKELREIADHLDNLTEGVKHGS